MKTPLKNRLIMVVAALILLPAFVLPIWTISLTAPQYPDGMGMYIGVSEVWGHDEFDIQNINILNHYIGMQAIDPEGIPELDIFPPILAAIIAAGLIAALVGRRWAMTVWLVGFIALGTAGMVDFYFWLIDYGHNLDPRAAIKIPGMTYTPPLIGTKQLLNITASSWPAIGSLFIFLSIALGAWAVIDSFVRPRRERREETERQPASSTAVGSSAAVVILALLLTGCMAQGERSSTAESSVDPADRIVYGESEDPHCGGLVQRVRWGGEIETISGDVYRFRSVECMAAFLVSENLSQSQIASVRAVDFPDGWKLIDVKDAFFLHTPNLASPAGKRLNVMAISTPKMARSLQEAYTGPLLSWSEVLDLVERQWGDSTTAHASSR